MNPSSNLNPTAVYLVQQITGLISTLAMLTSIVILAMQHLVEDGLLITLMVTAMGAHVVTQTSKSTPASTTATVTPSNVSTPESPAGQVNIGTTTIP